MKKISVAILGATGYTGAELIRFVEAHPYFDIAHLGAHSQAGKKAGEVLPGIAGNLAEMPTNYYPGMCRWYLPPCRMALLPAV